MDTVKTLLSKSPDIEILSQTALLKMLKLERKRSERSHRRFVLMLLKVDGLLKNGNTEKTLDLVLNALCRSTRETDIKGWYHYGRTLGVIFTEVGDSPRKSLTDTLSRKVLQALGGLPGMEDLDDSRLSFHIYPESFDRDDLPPIDPTLYPDLKQNSTASQWSLGLKRSIDIAGSLCGILLCLPVFFVIALLIKLTSKGPVLFRQDRIGRFGRPFTFLKFRSMYVNNDQAIHKEYVTQLISAKDGKSSSGSCMTFKLTGDPRITRVGRFLRRTSLDELPQLFNVLKGDMSLVGPRPPIQYEVTAYEPWHKNRLLAVRPGITGLWQVAGRSRVTFDEMVRLDLRYSTSWSLWLDLTILLQTPRAVISGQGAY